MSNRTPPFKADIVGSLLRPQIVLDARSRFAENQISRSDLREIETRAIEDAVDLQQSVGLEVCTDGEFRRRHWFLDFLEQISGLEVRGGLPIKFHNESGSREWSPPRFETVSQLRRPHPISVEDFKSLKVLADQRGLIAKQTIPSPMCAHFRGGDAAVQKLAYPDIELFFSDLAQIYRDEISDLYVAGCRYLQIDDTNLTFLCDDTLRAHARKIGENPDTLPGRYEITACGTSRRT